MASTHRPDVRVARSRRRRRALGPAIFAVAVTVVAALAPAASASTATVDAAVAFVVGEQRSDGGFGAAEAGFPAFETPDAVLAIAAAAQAGAWDADVARAAVEAVTTDGRSGLGYLDDLADDGVSAGVAARLSVVAVELGLDPAAFDPDGDGATDLVATMVAGVQPDGTLGAGVLNDTLYALLGHVSVGLALPDGMLAAVVDAQQANGSWDFTGDPSGTTADPDTTGLALRALVAAGLTVADEPVRSGLEFLAGAQLADGTFGESFAGESNPNSTALAALGITAAGFDPDEVCWRDVVAPERAGDPYGSPLAALVALQAADGHIASPFDEFGVNTLATSQSVLAITRTVPVARAATVECPEPPVAPVDDPGDPQPPIVGVPGPAPDADPISVADDGGAPAELPRTGSSAVLLALGAGLVALGVLGRGAARPTRPR